MHTSQLAPRTYNVFPLRFEALDAFAVPSEGCGTLYGFLDGTQALLRRKAADRASERGLPSLAPPAEERVAWTRQVRAMPAWSDAIGSYMRQYRPTRPFDTASHPLAMVLAVSSSHPDPMNAFAQLYEQSSSHDVFASQPYLETNVLRTYLVLHDAHAQGADIRRSEAVLEEVRQTYGIQCALLVVNTAPEPVLDVQRTVQAALDAPDLRAAPSQHDVAPGSALSAVDVGHLAVYVRELVVKSLVPFLERSVQQLNEQVGHSRHGLTGRLLGAGRKLFGSNRGAHATHVPVSGLDVDHGMYPPLSLAAQTRRLADYAFLLRDYRLAADMYEAVCRDYEQDEMALHLANATEILVYTRLLNQQVNAAQHEAMMRACSMYCQNPLGGLYALRATFLYTQLQQALGMYAYVAEAYSYAATFTEEVLRGAVLERAAWAYLSMPRPHVRKSAAVLLQSAEQLDACGQKALALRNYQVIAPYYEDQAWPAMRDNVLEKLAWQAQNNARYDDALTYLVKLMYTTQRTSKQDHAYLEQLLDVAKYVSVTEATQLPCPIWDERQCAIVNNAPTAAVRDRFMAAYPALAPILPNAGASTVGLQEAFVLRLHAQNPLQTNMALSEWTLSFVDSDGTPLAPENVHIDMPATLFLQARQAKTLDIHVRIATTGTFRLAGVQVLLENTVPVYQPFTRHGRRLHTTAAQRRTPTYAPNTSCVVRVRPNVPRLSVDTLGLPSVAYQGGSAQFALPIRSAGLASCKSLQVASFPLYGAVGEAHGMVGGSGSTSLPPVLPRPALEEIPSSLEGGQDTTWTCTYPVLTHGNTTFEWLFVYQNEEGEHFASYVTHTLEARPAVQGTASVRAAGGAPGYVLSLQVDNLTNEPVTLDGISMFSMQWATADHGDQVTLAPAESYTLVLSCKPKAHVRDETVPFALEAMAPLLGHTGHSAPTEPGPLAVDTYNIRGEGARMRQNMYVATRSALRSASLGAVYAFLPASLRQRAFLLMESNEVDFLVAWTLGGSVQGQSLLYGAQVGRRADAPAALAALHRLARPPAAAVRAMYEATTREHQQRIAQVLASPLAAWAAPLAVEVRPLTRPMHTASTAGAVRTAPVAVQVQNPSPWRVAYTLHLLPARSRPLPAQPIAPWIGRTRLRGTLEPGASESVQSQVAIGAPGAYQLGEWMYEAVLVGAADVPPASASGSSTAALVVQA